MSSVREMQERVEWAERGLAQTKTHEKEWSQYLEGAKQLLEHEKAKAGLK